MAVVLGAGPTVPAVLLTVSDPDHSRRWLWTFGAVLVALLGAAFGSDWLAWWRGRHDRAVRRRDAVTCKDAVRGRIAP
ncbi:hypothetical protein [Kitasatospora sp. NPDC059673]|uniref:hypothetical protein n=1 Tax=Kitasatospora sp. NPDC059673 TaxID=3346901 RepID=UPI0036D0D261